MFASPRLVLPALLLLGLAGGLCGIRWGLPSPSRFSILPSGLPPSSRTAQRLEESWSRLYHGIREAHKEMREDPVTAVQGVVEVPPGAESPPPGILSSYRSFLLQSENPDEKTSFIILSQMRPWKWEFKPLYMRYGGAYIYPLGIFLAVLRAVRVVQLTPHPSFYLMHPEAMGRLYLGGRLFVLIFYLGSLGFLYAAGRKLGGEKAGVLAAVLYLLCPIVVSDAHLIKPHAYAAFWCLASFYFSLGALDRGDARGYLFSGLCAGMAAGAAVTQAVFALLPGLAWISRLSARKAKPAELKRVAAAAAGSLGVFVLSNPYFLFSHSNFAMEARVTGHLLSAGSLLPLLLRNVFLNAMGPLWFAALPPALYFSQRSRRDPDLFLGRVFLAIFIFLFGGLAYALGETAVLARFYFPFFGLSCLLAGNFLAPRIKNPLWGALGLAILVDSGLRSAVIWKDLSVDSSRASTYRRAASWIDSHLPSQASVGLMGEYPQPAHVPPFRLSRHRLVLFESPAKLSRSRLPEYVVTDRYFRREMASWLPPRYQLLKEFLPARLGWAGYPRFSFYADQAFQVWRLKK